MKEKIRSHKELNVWKRSIDLVVNIYKILEEFPKNEEFILVSQLKRSAISIPSNIAEGAARKGRKEFSRFLFISLGSISELETQIEIAKQLQYISLNKFVELECEIIIIKKMLIKLIQSINK